MMKFEMLDKKMRVFEQNMDQLVLPGLYIIARLDGRGFTKLTKERLDLERPFDLRFRDAMIETTKHLMDAGFKITYGYTGSDEISLLFDKNENSFGRKARKLVSILAGEASARFTQALGTLGVFDCRIIPLPNDDLVVDYFRWRCEDASRNALNAWCYWKLREKGLSASEATKQLEGRSVAEKNEMLFQVGINYNDLPAWQKRGVGLFYTDMETTSVNPMDNREITVSRKQLTVEMELPRSTEYDILIKKRLTEQTP
ncbi:tRNA(His) guanylyltransferase Thg1 family protein [Chryseolinea serpens]|nr:tRNA(His) guanylyltransferase Thg1 family protein [Chryseolinea serpens]